jgi:hypothetical protein
MLCARGDAATIKLSNESPLSLTQEVHFVPEKNLLRYTARDAEPTLSERKLNNKLVVWSMPDRSIEVRNRYIVVFDPARGVTDGADWGVICVLDRYWRMYGGKSEVVAEWRGHTDKDIAIWIAVQAAIWYCDALLIVESETYSSTFKKDNYNEYVFETISRYYSNLYCRPDRDRVKENIPIRYGFSTNRNTKPSIVHDFQATLRQSSYIERSHRTLDQACVYERKKDGSYGAKDGYHDDDIMTRMIGLYVDYHELPLPEMVVRKKERTFDMMSESKI